MMIISAVGFSVLTMLIAVVGMGLLSEAMTFMNRLLGFAELSVLSRIGVALFEAAIMVLVMTAVVVFLCKKIAELIE